MAPVKNIIYTLSFMLSFFVFGVAHSAIDYTPKKNSKGIIAKINDKGILIVSSDGGSFFYPVSWKGTTGLAGIENPRRASWFQWSPSGDYLAFLTIGSSPNLTNTPPVKGCSASRSLGIYYPALKATYWVGGSGSFRRNAGDHAEFGCVDVGNVMWDDDTLVFDEVVQESGGGDPYAVHREEKVSYSYLKEFDESVGPMAYWVTQKIIFLLKSNNPGLSGFLDNLSFKEEKDRVALFNALSHNKWATKEAQWEMYVQGDRSIKYYMKGFSSATFRLVIFWYDPESGYRVKETVEMFVRSPGGSWYVKVNQE